MYSDRTKVQRTTSTNHRSPATYLRAPAWGFFKRDCRSLPDLRLGLLITKVPLPWYSAEYVFSSTMEFPLSHETSHETTTRSHINPGLLLDRSLPARRRSIAIRRNLR